VGTTIAAISMIAGMLWWYRNQSTKRSSKRIAQPQAGALHELPGTGYLGRKWLSKSRGVAEAPSDMVPVELDGAGNPGMYGTPTSFANGPVLIEHCDPTVHDP
jgi:hypothetical protein